VLGGNPVSRQLSCNIAPSRTIDSIVISCRDTDDRSARVVYAQTCSMPMCCNKVKASPWKKDEQMTRRTHNQVRNAVRRKRKTAVMA
jgi:hypothetical protein